jgi:predicted amidohydrolase YtcJ
MAARLTALLVCAIVGATLVAGLIVGAQRDAGDEPVDLIVLNGSVFTADGSGAIAEAVAIRGNQILRVGSNREIKRLRRRSTLVIDAHGGSVLPGFNDAHVRLLRGGVSLDQLDLHGASSVAEIERRLVTFADAYPDRRWIQGRGWPQSAFASGLPSRQTLDSLISDRPVYLVGEDGRTLWVNSKTLELAGITRGTPSPRNGTIVRDPKTREPTGVLKGTAVTLVARLLPEASLEERLVGLRAATREAHRRGITSIQSAGDSLEDLEVYDLARRAGDLQVRVYASLSVGPSLSDDSAGQLDAAWHRFPDDPLLKTGAVTLDLGSVTAGEVSDRPLGSVVERLDRRGWQVMVHATGETDVRSALDAFEQAARVNPMPDRGRRHRIEHAETIAPDDVVRLAEGGVIASVQPSTATSALTPRDLATGPPAENSSSAWLGSLGASVRLAFGSDWPSAPLDPLPILQAAITFPTVEGPQPDRGPSEPGLPLARAIEAYTSGAAWASFDERRKGTLAPGMLADLVVLSTDVFALPPEKVQDALVTTTIFDGRVVFSEDGDSD